MIASLLLLFGVSFLAATILPFYSEVLLFAQLEAGGTPWLLVVVATAGNTLGSVVNWALGRFLLRFQDRRWFFFSRAQVDRAQRWFRRFGVWCLLLAWMPVGGDALTLVAGIMRTPLPLFLVLVALGKAVRYVSVAALAGWLG